MRYDMLITIMDDVVYSYTNDKKKRQQRFFVTSGLVCIIVGIALFLHVFSQKHLDTNTVVTIPSGYSVQQTARSLYEYDLVRSPFAFSLYSRLHSESIKAGTYRFIPGAYSLSDIHTRLTTAEYGDIYIRLTIPEGSTRNEIARILEESELAISGDEFLKQTQNLEGYLFPDTYFLLPDSSVEDIVSIMQQTFDTTLEEYEDDIRNSGRSFEDIITMASIIEKEATSDPEEMKLVSGILWKRIDEGMLLQVDAPFLYTQGKTSEQLRIADLRADGPYNTYTRIGLTPTPISNPGKAAIEAAIHPTESLYYFYLHDTNGTIRYGITHDDHVRNKQRYLP
jgi:UPF0755 protein